MEAIGVSLLRINPIRAAEYLRMSTDAQHYSIPQQQTIIREYAAQHGMVIVRTYADEGKSGLTLHGREALGQLLSDVQSGRADYQVVLVYDVSRWGRFQDVDESGYYEFLCRKANVRIEYCAEPFANQPGPLVTILKSIKRAMAAEYSRELASKIAFAMRRGTMKGYLQGGRPGYALRRMLVGPDGRHIQILERGAHKGLKEYRTILVPGPRHEVHTVRRIFDLYTERRLDSPTIADLLNRDGIEYEPNRCWTKVHILAVLRNERYTGVLVVNRRSSNLASGRVNPGFVRHSPSEWVRAPTGFDGFISNERFELARKIRRIRGLRYRNDGEMLESLRDLLERRGRLSTDIINAERLMPKAPAFLRHFGSLRRAYELIGYKQAHDWGALPQSQHRLRIAEWVVTSIAEAVVRTCGASEWHRLRKQLMIDGRRTIAVAIGRCSRYSGGLQWHVSSSRIHFPDLMIIVRLDAANHEPLDYLCLPPALAATLMNRQIRDCDLLRPYRHSTIEDVITIALQHERFDDGPTNLCGCRDTQIRS